MEPHAQASCILSVNVECGACKAKVMEVLSSIIGVYSVEFDEKHGRVKVFGEVDPNIILRALARTGKHAKLVWAKLNHPLVNRTYQGHHHSSYNYGYGSAALEDSYRYGRALHGSLGHDAHHDQYYPMRRLAPDYPSYCATYYSDYTPVARHVPSYHPAPNYDPYQDEPFNTCNIM